MEPVRPATGSGELLPTQDKAAVQSTMPGEASEPSHSTAPTELCKQEVAGELIPKKTVSSGTQDRSGESLPAKPVCTDTFMTTERPTPLATAVAGSHTHTSVADAPQSGGLFDAFSWPVLQTWGLCSQAACGTSVPRQGG